MESCVQDKIIELRNLVEDVLPWLPSDQELQTHLHHANGNVQAALNSLVDRWELREEQKDYQAQESELHAPDNFLKQLPISSSADLIPEGFIPDPSEPLRGSDPAAFPSPHLLPEDANFVGPALGTEFKFTFSTSYRIPCVRSFVDFVACQFLAGNSEERFSSWFSSAVRFA